MANVKKKYVEEKENKTTTKTTTTKKPSTKKETVKKADAKTTKKVTGKTKEEKVKKEKKTAKKTTKSKVPKVTSKTTKLDVIKLDDTRIINLTQKDLKEKTKSKASEKSRKANEKKHSVSAKKRKREATRIIPVDKILEAQRKLEEKELLENQGIKEEISNKNKKTTKTTKSSKSFKNVKKPVNRSGKETKKKQLKESKIDKIRYYLSRYVNRIRARFNNNNIFKTITLVCLVIIAIECLYLLVLKNTIFRGTYYETYNSVKLDNNELVIAGTSDFKYSSKYNYQGNNTRAKLVKYDKNGNVILEKMYDKGINSTYNDIIVTNEGYVAVGSYAKDKEQDSNNLRDAIIVKYDKSGKVIWNKTFSSLSNTSFNKVIEVDDGYVVIGQSIYANMEMGNSTEGGGVIIKYSTDGEIIWKNFHGGTKSASFNGIVEVDGWLYVVGRDGTDFGNIVQFNAKGVYQWHKNYRYTDTLGFSDIVYKNNRLYVVGSKEIFTEEVNDNSTRDTNNTDALLVCFGMDGEVLFEKTFGGSLLERFNSVVVYRNSIIAVGHSTSIDSGLKNYTDGFKTSGILVKYDLDGNSENKLSFGGSNTDTLTSVITDNSNVYISSYSQSKDGNLAINKANGKDYFGSIVKLDSRLHILFIK